MKILNIIKEIKNNKLLRSSIFMSIASFVTIFAVFTFMNKSAGWFSNNKVVSAKGMSIVADAGESLSIIPYKDENIPIGGTRMEDPDEGVSLLPATKVGNVIQYLTNDYDIDPSTGKLKDGKTAVYANGIAETHYHDYQSIISAVGGSLGSSQLTFKLNGLVIGENSADESATLVETDAYKYIKSLTVDIYCSETAPTDENPGRLVGTMYADSMGTEIKDGTAINLDAGKKFYITFRAYFDGAKTDGTNAYYNSVAMEEKITNKAFENVAVNVHIEAPAAETGG